MENNKEKIEHYEIVIWNMMKSLSDVKECVRGCENYPRKDLEELQDKMQEAAQWLIKYTTE